MSVEADAPQALEQEQDVSAPAVQLVAHGLRVLDHLLMCAAGVNDCPAKRR